MAHGGGREGPPPRPDTSVLDPDLIFTMPSRVVAWGTVEAIPWQIDPCRVEPGPEAKWWELGPIGPGLRFVLGGEGAFGGGDLGTLLNDGTHLQASIDFYG